MNEPLHDRIAAETPTSLGQRLSKARKVRGWTLGYAASQLRLPESTVESLESDNYGQLPAEVYVKGYLRNYARLLRLSPDEIVQAYFEQRESAAGGLSGGRKSAELSPRRSGRQSTSMPLGRAGRTAVEREWPTSAPVAAMRWVGAALVLAFFATWWWPEENDAARQSWWTELQAALAQYSAPHETSERADPHGIRSEPSATSTELAVPPQQPVPARSTDAPSEGIVPATEPVAGKAPDSQPAMETVTTSKPALDTLVLRFEDASWATVIDADGNRLLYETGQKGATKTMSGKAPFNLTIGRIANVAIEFNGQPVNFPNAKNRATEHFSVPLKTGN